MLFTRAFAFTLLCLAAAVPAAPTDRSATLENINKLRSLSVIARPIVARSGPSLPKPAPTGNMLKKPTKTLFQRKLMAKTLNRQAKNAQKGEKTEKAHLNKALQRGDTEGARIHAMNAIRKKSEAQKLQQ